MLHFVFFYYLFLPQKEVSLSTRRFLQNFTMILQRTMIIVGYASFKPETAALAVWSTTNEPPHYSANIFGGKKIPDNLIITYYSFISFIFKHSLSVGAK